MMTEPNTYYSATFVYDDASIDSLIEYKLGLWSTEELAMKAIKVFKHSEQGEKVRLRFVFLILCMIKDQKDIHTQSTLSAKLLLINHRVVQ